MKQDRALAYAFIGMVAVFVALIVGSADHETDEEAERREFIAHNEEMSLYYQYPDNRPSIEEYEDTQTFILVDITIDHYCANISKGSGCLEYVADGKAWAKAWSTGRHGDLADECNDCMNEASYDWWSINRGNPAGNSRIANLTWWEASGVCHEKRCGGGVIE